MQCPRCSVPLTVTNKHGVEIDRCNSCQGVWLDKGELDKVMAYSGQRQQPNQQENPLMDLFDMFGG